MLSQVNPGDRTKDGYILGLLPPHLPQVIETPNPMGGGTTRSRNYGHADTNLTYGDHFIVST